MYGEVQRVPILMKKGVPVRLPAMRPEHEVDLVGHLHWRAERARALPSRSPVSKTIRPPAAIDSHFADLTANRRFHIARGEELVELSGAEQRERVGTAGFAKLHAEHALHAGARYVVPHHLRIAQKSRAFVAQGIE